jgi:hypothetical protein
MPTSTWATVVPSDVTGTGTSDKARLPIPSCPSSFRPQHDRLPSSLMAQLEPDPGATCRMPAAIGTGESRVVLVPSPSGPSSFSPQHSSVASFMTAQVWKAPAATAATFAPSDFTCTGDGLLTPVPSPSWPSSFAPQHHRVLSSRTAQVCAPPAEICVALPSPVTCAGTGETSKPPQHQTVPSCLRAHVWRPPAETSAITGVQHGQVPPQPSLPPHLPPQIGVQQTAGPPGFILQRLSAPHELSFTQVGHLDSSRAQICKAPFGLQRFAPMVQGVGQAASGPASA